MYNETKRVAKHSAVLLDYNNHRSWSIDIIERLEGGDYFYLRLIIFLMFISHALPCCKYEQHSDP